MKAKPIILFTFPRQLLLFLGICLFAASASGQVEDLNKFASVPAPIRDRLIERLNLYIEFDRTNQYGKKFDLFSEAYRTGTWKSKADYVKFSQDEEAKGIGRRLIAFNISSVESDSLNSLAESDDRIFRINGVVKFRQGNKLKKKKWFLQARYQNGEWYFSDWLVNMPIEY